MGRWGVFWVGVLQGCVPTSEGGRGGARRGRESWCAATPAHPSPSRPLVIPSKTKSPHACAEQGEGTQDGGLGGGGQLAIHKRDPLPLSRKPGTDPPSPVNSLRPPPRPQHNPSPAKKNQNTPLKNPQNKGQQLKNSNQPFETTPTCRNAMGNPQNPKQFQKNPTRRRSRASPPRASQRTPPQTASPPGPRSSAAR